MVVFYIAISVFIAWVWIDYFRMIDVFRRNEILPTIIVFILGAASTQVVFGLHQAFPNFHIFNESQSDLSNLLYNIFDIGMIEELAKLIPFLLLSIAWVKHFEEPIDYVYFISISALGFACFENILYFNNHGPTIINGRSILSTVGHMFDSSVIAYGIIRYRFITKKYSYIAFPFYLLLSSLSHGLYDYFASQENKLSFICTMMIFLFTVSIYSTVLNNCLNISQHFTYKKMINQWEVIWKMLRYYIVIFLFQFLLLSYTKTFFIALKNLNGNIAVIGFIVFVVVVRLSRFKLIKGRWNKIKLELPFTFAFSTPINPIGPKLIIKGDGFSETSINQYYHENFIASPLTIKRTFIQTPKVGYIEEKVFAKRDESYYIIHLQITENLPPERFLIVPKKFGTTAINNKFPIVALLRIPEQQIKLENNDFENIKFLEWIFLKPIENKTITINQKIIFT